VGCEQFSRTIFVLLTYCAGSPQTGNVFSSLRQNLKINVPFRNTTYRRTPLSGWTFVPTINFRSLSTHFKGKLLPLMLNRRTRLSTLRLRSRTRKGGQFHLPITLFVRLIYRVGSLPTCNVLSSSGKNLIMHLLFHTIISLRDRHFTSFFV
jgi:hypothetical protein